MLDLLYLQGRELLIQQGQRMKSWPAMVSSDRILDIEYAKCALMGF